MVWGWGGWGGGDNPKDNSKIMFLYTYLNENIHCDPSSETSRRDGSSEGSQCMFLQKNKENYLFIISVTPSYLEHYIGITFPVLLSSVLALFYNSRQTGEIQGWWNFCYMYSPTYFNVHISWDS